MIFLLLCSIVRLPITAHRCRRHRRWRLFTSSRVGLRNMSGFLLTFAQSRGFARCVFACFFLRDRMVRGGQKRNRSGNSSFSWGRICCYCCCLLRCAIVPPDRIGYCPSDNGTDTPSSLSLPRFDPGGGHFPDRFFFCWRCPSSAVVSHLCCSAIADHQTMVCAGGEFLFLPDIGTVRSVTRTLLFPCIVSETEQPPVPNPRTHRQRSDRSDAASMGIDDGGLSRCWRRENRRSDPKAIVSLSKERAMGKRREIERERKKKTRE